MNWEKITSEELKLGMDIATLKKEELQVKYVKDISVRNTEIERLNNIINELEDIIVIKLERDYHEPRYRINTGDLEEIYDRLKELKENK